MEQLLADRLDPFLALGTVGLLQRWLAEEEARLVPLARSGGASWFDIGRWLGRTRQSVWERYHTSADETPA
jgi:hypothetical protein